MSDIKQLILSSQGVRAFVRINLRSLSADLNSPKQILIRPFIPGYRIHQFIATIFPVEHRKYWKYYRQDAGISHSGTFDEYEIIELIEYLYTLGCINETIVQIGFNYGAYEVLLSETKRREHAQRSPLEVNLRGFAGWDHDFGPI